MAWLEEQFWFGIEPDELEWEVYQAQRKTERRWKRGKHLMKDGKFIEIKDMTDSHLLNTIKFFKHLNTKPLEKEAVKRGLIKA